MKITLSWCVLLLLAVMAAGSESRQYLVRLSEDDTFTVGAPTAWDIQVVKSVAQRQTDIRVTPKGSSTFSLVLYFKRDTADLSIFDTPEKMKDFVMRSTQRYLDTAVEKEVRLQPINHRGRYGYYAVLTNAALASRATVPEGKFKFTTRGMVRLSTDSALGFSLMTNELNSKEYKELLDYVLSFVQPAG